MRSGAMLLFQGLKKIKVFQSAVTAESRRTEASPQGNTLTTMFHREDGVLWVVHLLLCSPNISSISLASSSLFHLTKRQGVLSVPLSAEVGFFPVWGSSDRLL